jgi:hypothetical protein
MQANGEMLCIILKILIYGENCQIVAGGQGTEQKIGI